MSRNEYRYYRYRRIKRTILVFLLSVLAAVILTVLICDTYKSGSVKNDNSRNEIGELNRADFLDSKKVDGEVTGDIKNIKGKQADKKPHKRKKAIIINPATEPVAIEKVKKAEPEKKLPPKPPTLEIIGSKGDVLMKKE